MSNCDKWSPNDVDQEHLCSPRGAESNGGSGEAFRNEGPDDAFDSQLLFARKPSPSPFATDVISCLVLSAEPLTAVDFVTGRFTLQSGPKARNPLWGGEQYRS